MTRRDNCEICNERVDDDANKCWECGASFCQECESEFEENSFMIFRKFENPFVLNNYSENIYSEDIKRKINFYQDYKNINLYNFIEPLFCAKMCAFLDTNTNFLKLQMDIKNVLFKKNDDEERVLPAEEENNNNNNNDDDDDEDAPPRPTEPIEKLKWIIKYKFLFQDMPYFCNGCYKNQVIDYYTCNSTYKM